MPIIKHPRKQEPLWREWDKTANKSGQRHTIYSVNGDNYTGEWKDNLKNGKGTQYWKRKNGSRELYDGDWKDNNRHGFGTLSKSKNEQGYLKVYSGGWKNDKRHGQGTQFYDNEENYDGEWHAGKRCGWGRMHYKDGSVFEGLWNHDKREGTGVLRISNGNRYEGEWSNDVKNGEGKMYFVEKGQLLIGTWVDNVMKCGTFEDYARETATNPPQYPIPKCKLKDQKEVLKLAQRELYII